MTLLAMGQLLDSEEKYIESFLWLKDERAQVIPFYLNEPQRYMLQEKRRAVRAGRKPHFFTLKSRREGATTLEQALNFKRATTRANSNVVTLAHETEATEK